MSKCYDNLFDINEDQLNIGYSSKTSKKLSFKDINFSKPVQNINLKSNIVNLSNDNNLSENLADISFELEDNTYSKNLEIDPNTNILDEFENTLQVLVTKYKLSNAAGNAIISFLINIQIISNLHYQKNIKQGKLFINNMKYNLLYNKTKVLDYDNTKYFLYYMPLMSCIQNILEISDITQTFALEYEELYKTTKNSKENIYKEQNNRKW
ncbi:zn-finger domain-containing protein [Gigaspora margarita]|uniref:Zn-finger domain-containing protein n=1 Tax=Gigaspora margarita TaxID=4874 RepID=A0A8H3XJK2_GIGMA|nr:zn-finger domain-containing protein [Gigaspora margarita]